MSWRLLGYGALLSVLFSCIDDGDYQLDELQVNPSLALPLVKGELTIRDFLSDKDSADIKIYPDGLMYLAYQQELKTQGIEELFQVDDKSVNRSFILPAAVLPAFNKDLRTDSLSFILDLGLSPEQLNEIALKKGTLTYSTSIVPSTTQLDYEVLVSIPEFVSRTNNKPLSLSAKGTGNVNLNTHTMFINNNKFAIKLVLVIKKHANPISIPGGTSININLAFQSMDFLYLKGFFGTQTASLPAQTIQLGAFQNAFSSADVSLAAPKITLSVRNDYGVPSKVDFKQLVARKNGTSMDVLLSPANPITLNTPTTMGASATTDVTITNVNDLLNFAPDEFYYQSDAKINDGITSGSNFLTDTSKLAVKMNIEIPFYGHASNIIVQDTVDLDLSDADQSQIETASLKLKLLNELPLDGSIQFFLTDQNYVVIGNLLATDQTNLIKGSSVNATGDLQTAGIYDASIQLEPEKLKRIFEAKHLIIVANFSTSKDANGNYPDVKFKADYTLSIEAGILAKLKLSVKL